MYALTGDVLDVDQKLGNEMADVIAQVIRLAEYYNIDLEKAFIEAREDENNYIKTRGVLKVQVKSSNTFFDLL